MEPARSSRDSGIFGRWSLTKGRREKFRSAGRYIWVNDFALVETSADPLVGERTGREIENDDSHFFSLICLLEGAATLQQGRNEAIVRANQLILWDSSRPAMFLFPDESRQISFLIPHRLALATIPDIEDRCGVSLDGATGLGKILRSHLHQLCLDIESVDLAYRPGLFRSSLDMIGAAFHPIEDALDIAMRRPALKRVQDYILTHLSDPALSATNIASALGYSPRYLHRLFEGFDITVGALIRRRRLLASQADLASTRPASLSITQIAMRYGFCEPSHFSRAFKEEFGVSPREFRRQRQGNALPAPPKRWRGTIG